MRIWPRKEPFLPRPGLAFEAGNDRLACRTGVVRYWPESKSDGILRGLPLVRTHGTRKSASRTGTSWHNDAKILRPLVLGDGAKVRLSVASFRFDEERMLVNSGAVAFREKIASAEAP